MFDPERITFDSQVKGGRACIRGMRITVSLILNLLANGMTKEEILEDYPYLEPEDIQAVLSYAAWLADESVGGVASVSATASPSYPSASTPDSVCITATGVATEG